MSPAKTEKLRTKLREIIEKAQNAGARVTTRSLVDEVMGEFPDLVEEAKDMLFREAIAKWTRTMLKSEAATMKSAQFALPNVLSHLKLPASLSLPPAPVVLVEGQTQEEVEAEASTDVVWTPFEAATFSELEAHIKLLQGNVSSAISTLNTLRQIYQFLRPHMEEHHRDDPIGPMLSELAAKERDAA